MVVLNLSRGRVSLYHAGEDLTFSDQLQCNLFIVAECITTNGLSDPYFSTAFFNNFPQASNRGSCKDVPIWKACRASSAAPTYFRPMEMPYDGKFSVRTPQNIMDKTATMVDFTDGGMSGYNNPENAMLEALTHCRYGIKFEQGRDR